MNRRQTAAGGDSRAERPDPPVAAQWECRARNASGTILLDGGPYGSETEAVEALAGINRRHAGLLRHSWVQEVGR